MRPFYARGAGIAVEACRTLQEAEAEADAVHVAHFVPAYRGRLHARVAQSMARDAGFAARAGWSYTTMFVDLGRIDLARNNAVAHALEINADVLLMQDEDTFAIDEASPLERLWSTMRSQGAAVVGALVRVRGGVVLRNGTAGVVLNCRGDMPADNVVTWDGAVGTGLMLIDLRATREVPRPWFSFATSRDGLRTELGEDLAFCERVQAAGLRVVVDAGLTTVHVDEEFAVSEARRLEREAR